MLIVDDPLLALILCFVSKKRGKDRADEEFIQRQIRTLGEYVAPFPPEQQGDRAMEWIERNAADYRRTWQRRQVSHDTFDARCADCPLRSMNAAPHCEVREQWLYLLRRYMTGEVSSPAYVEDALRLLKVHKKQLGRRVAALTGENSGEKGEETPQVGTFPFNRRPMDSQPRACIMPSFHAFGLRSGALASAAAISLSACIGSIPRDPASPWYRVPAGSTLSFQHKIEIPPDRTRVFLQHGAITITFNHYAVNCNVEVRKLDYEAVQYLEPATYRVSSVQDTVEEVVQAAPLQLATTDASLAMGDEGGSDPMIYRGYHLWLEGPDPNLMRLSCRGAFADPHEAYPPSIDEIRAALGDIAHLQLAEQVP
jgi:hypothetical protein